jgi:hypothetical protein
MTGISGREALATFGTAALEDFTTTRSGLTGAESGGAGTFSFGGLIGSFGHGLNLKLKVKS